MRRYESIIQSETAPSTSSLWIHDGKFQFYNNGKWADVYSIEGWNNKNHVTPSDLMGYLPYITDIMFVIGGDNTAARELFELYEYDYLFDHIPVMLVNGPNQAKFGILGMYYNGQITVITDGKMIIYNVNYNDDTWPVCKINTVDLTLLPTYVDLELGNSSAVKAHNRELLLKVAGTQFFVHADYGIGVGSWHANTGGATTINTANGDRVHYIITSEGECKVDDEHFDHSELFFNLGTINFNDFDADRKLTFDITDSVRMHSFKKADNLTLKLNTDIGVFDVICDLDSISITRRLFLSPKIYADGENETTLRIAASIFTDKITFEITETTV